MSHHVWFTCSTTCGARASVITMPFPATLMAAAYRSMRNLASRSLLRSATKSVMSWIVQMNWRISPPLPLEPLPLEPLPLESLPLEPLPLGPLSLLSPRTGRTQKSFQNEVPPRR